jgi:trimeric autotransporter adhesin
MVRTHAQRVTAIAAAVIFAPLGLAQCPLLVRPLDVGAPPFGGVDGVVTTQTLWDPDGPGPGAARLVVGGTFPRAGGVYTQNIAAFDLTSGTWSRLAGGLNAEPTALATLPDNSLVAVGPFAIAGDLVVPGIARWDGTSWSRIDTGLRSISTVHRTPDGSLLGVGTFRTGPTLTAGIGRFDGTRWSLLVPASIGGTVTELTTLPDGQIVIAGWIWSVGDLQTSNIARWDGSAWRAFGPGLRNNGRPGDVRSLAVLDSGELVAGGTFSLDVTGASRNIARWTGSEWVGFGSGSGDPVDALLATPNGLVATGRFGSPPPFYYPVSVARWTGSAWAPLGTEPIGPRSTSLISLPDGSLVVGGGRMVVAGRFVDGVARWDGAGFRSLGGIAGGVDSILETSDGRTFIAGNFNFDTPDGPRFVARLEGGAWRSLGDGVDGPVSAIVERTGGTVVAAGSFSSAGGVPADGIAEWTGSGWRSLGPAPIRAPISTLVALPGGVIVAGGPAPGSLGSFRFARWDGTSWSTLGETFSGAAELAQDPGGELVAGGYLFRDVPGGSIGPIVVRWNGAAWDRLGVDDRFSVWSLAVLPDGDVLVAGRTSGPGSSESGIFRWDGSTWSPFTLGGQPSSPGYEFATAIQPLAGGDVLVAGVTGGGVQGLTRWDGASWRPVVPGFDVAPTTLALTPSGRVLVGGSFSLAGGSISPRLAQLVPAGTPIAVTQQPIGRLTCPGGGVSFSVTASGSDIAYRWYRGNIALELTNPPADDPTLVLPAVGRADAGEYWCMMSNPCGVVRTVDARLWVCTADFACDGDISPRDIFAFLRAYFAGDPRADLDGDGGFSSADTFIFLDAYFAGC